MNITKRIEYSYPTSPNAKHFGFYKTGCYTVVTINYDTLSTMALAGYLSIDDAIKHADKLPYEWDKKTQIEILFSSCDNAAPEKR